MVHFCLGPTVVYTNHVGYSPLCSLNQLQFAFTPPGPADRSKPDLLYVGIDPSTLSTHELTTTDVDRSATWWRGKINMQLGIRVAVLWPADSGCDPV